MKYTVVVLAFLLGLANAQEGNCRCAAMITTQNAEKIVYELPTIQMDCDHTSKQCTHRCYQEYDGLTDGGDLFKVSSDGERTVGQVVCDSLGHNIKNEYIYVYAELCDANWLYTNGQSMQPLCCVDGKHIDCA